MSRFSWLLSTVSIAAAASATTVAGELFRGAIDVPLEHRAAALATADLDGDGAVDAAVALEDTRLVRVLLRDAGSAPPDPIFRPPADYETGVGALSIAVGDLDGTKGPDLLVVNSGSSSVAVLLNRGDGRFDDARSFAVGLGPRVARLADFNRDGRLDAVTTNLGSFDLDVLLGDGRGDLARRSRLPVGDNPHFVIADDFDGDGAPDIAVAHRDDRVGSGAVAYFRGRGDGTFDDLRDTDLREADAVPEFIAPGDFDADGDVDIAVLAGDRRLLLLENDGAAAFDVVVAAEDSGASPNRFTGFLLAPDFDGDGRFDLVTPRERLGNYGFRLHRGSGTGAFEPSDVFLDAEIAHLALGGDFTGDGIADALAAWAERTGLAVVPGLPGGGFSTRSVLPLAASPRGLVVLDLDADGDRDLVAVASGAIYPARTGGDGALAPLEATALEGRAIQDVVAADLDREEGLELALADLAGGEIVLVWLDADGRAERTLARAVGALPSRLAAADVDGDRFPDLLVGHQAGTSITLLLRPGVDPAMKPVTLDVGASQTAIAAGDLDGDGDVDAAAATRDGLRLLLGDGGGGFPARRDLDAIVSAQALRVVDLDRDGAGEIVLPQGQGLVVLRGAAGDAPERTDIDLGVEVRPVDAADVDGDGLVDLATASPAAVLVLRGLAGGGFADPRAFAVGSSPRALIVVDLDGDGAADCATADFNSRAVSVLHGVRDGAAPSFRRGDADAGGAVQITDAIRVLEWLFRGAAAPPCVDAADADDDGKVNITDPVRILEWLFRGGAPPPPPGPATCGSDPTADGLSCERPCGGGRG